jgi:hypothetical protein
MLNENNIEVFNYQVNTIMPITGLSIGNIMVPSTVKLTKEDVLKCLEKAPVFRRFNNTKLIRVTVSNLDRLHNEKFMTESEYEEFVDKLSDARGIVEIPSTIEEKKETGAVGIKENIVAEEPVVEAETIAQTEEQAEATLVNDEGVSEEDEPVAGNEEDTTVENNSDRNYRHNNKKKHNR